MGSRDNIFYVVDARSIELADIKSLANRLHESDLREIKAQSGRDPIDSIKFGIERSTASWAVINPDDMQVDGVFGVVGQTLTSVRGVPWLLRCYDADRYRKHYVRTAPAFVARMLDLHPELSNACGAWALGTLRWLKRMGFTIHPAKPTGRNGEMLHHFEIRKRHV